MARLFCVGDKITHPMHGAGVIDSIVEKKNDGLPEDIISENSDGRHAGHDSYRKLQGNRRKTVWISNSGRSFPRFRISRWI